MNSPMQMSTADGRVRRSRQDPTIGAYVRQRTERCAIRAYAGMTIQRKSPMNGKTFSNKWSQRGSGLSKSSISREWAKTMPGHRYARYRTSGQDVRFVNSPVSCDARRIAVEPLDAPRQVESSAAKQQRAALNAWEDEGGAVTLRAPRRGE
jgi:hypothetical protein